MPNDTQSTPPVSQCSRMAEKSEFMPADYFRRYSSNDIFGNDNPLEIDLGCGDGSFLIEMAKHYPERNFLGVERLLGRVRGVCKRIHELRLTNVKVLRLESQYTLEYLLEPLSVSRLHLLCPDPWPKARHHKRRLIQQDFLHILHQVLIPNGEFLFKTDHPEYHEWALEQVEAYNQKNPERKFTHQAWPEDHEEHGFFYPKTDFEILWEIKGKVVCRMRLVKSCREIFSSHDKATAG